MANIIDNNLLTDLFITFPTLNTIWFQGDLSTFSNTELIIDDASIIGDVINFFGIKYSAFDVTCGLTVYDSDFFHKYGFSLSADMGYTECKRSDYV